MHLDYQLVGPQGGVEKSHSRGACGRSQRINTFLKFNVGMDIEGGRVYAYLICTVTRFVRKCELYMKLSASHP